MDLATSKRANLRTAGARPSITRMLNAYVSSSRATLRPVSHAPSDDSRLRDGFALARPKKGGGFRRGRADYRREAVLGYRAGRKRRTARIAYRTRRRVCRRSARV